VHVPGSTQVNAVNNHRKICLLVFHKVKRESKLF